MELYEELTSLSILLCAHLGFIGNDSGPWMGLFTSSPVVASTRVGANSCAEVSSPGSGEERGQPCPQHS